MARRPISTITKGIGHGLINRVDRSQATSPLSSMDYICTVHVRLSGRGKFVQTVGTVHPTWELVHAHRRGRRSLRGLYAQYLWAVHSVSTGHVMDPTFWRLPASRWRLARRVETRVTWLTPCRKSRLSAASSTPRKLSCSWDNAPGEEA